MRRIIKRCVHRPHTFSEPVPRPDKVDYASLEKKLDTLEASFEKEATDLFDRELEKFVKALTIAGAHGDTDKIRGLTLRVRGEYKGLLKDKLKTAYEYGKATAVKEMGVKTPGTPAEIARYIDLYAEAVAERHLTQMETDAKLKISDAVIRKETTAIALAVISEKLADATKTLVRDTGGIVIAGFVNKGRREVFDQNSDDIYALQRSEVLDRNTCNYCLSIDGRIIDKNDPFGLNDTFHTNCRGIWVTILKDEEGKPAISGIPKTLRDRFGESVNDLIQPKKPITKANTLARKYVLKRIRKS